MHHNHQPFKKLKSPNASIVVLALVAAVALMASQWLIFVYAPTEATLGFAQKIFYLHVPLAWWGLLSFFLVFIASIAFLMTKKKKWNLLALAAAEIGLLFASFALIAGSFWARSSWGVWWMWDPRLTTTLIMCFIYAGYLIVAHLEIPEDKRDKMVAVIGIIAFIDVPLVYLSSRLWNFIHPPSVELDPKMRLTMWACVGALSFFWGALLLFRFHLAQAEQHVNQLANLCLMHSEKNDQ